MAEAFANATILLTWTSVGLLFLRNIFPKPLVVLAVVPFFIIGLLKDLAFGAPVPLYLAMLVDLVKLEPLPRILSFMTLGFGFLGLGFVYNRWQDRLKQIL